MTPYIIIFIVNMTALIVGYFIGHNQAKKDLFHNMAEDPDRIISICNRLKELAAEDEQADLEVYSEHHNGKWFIYNKETHAFIAQGETEKEAFEAAVERFPGKWTLNPQDN